MSHLAATRCWQELATEGVEADNLLVSVGEQILMAAHSLVIAEHEVVSFISS